MQETVKYHEQSDRYDNSELVDRVRSFVRSSLQELRTRIEVVANLYKTRKNAASEMEVSEDMLRRYIKGENEPSGGALAKLAGPVGVSLEWLLIGRGPMFLTMEQLDPTPYELVSAFHQFDNQLPVEFTREAAVQEFVSKYNAGQIPHIEGVHQIAVERLNELLATRNEADWSKAVTTSAVDDVNDFASIPLYDVRAAAGSGSLVEAEQVVDVLHFKRSWIRSGLNASPNDLYLIYVDGESMEPTLRAGDVILVDRRDTGPARDGIYVLRMDNALLVKRLQRLPGGKVKVSSDNPAYAPFTSDVAEIHGEQSSIIGRVVWSGRLL